MPSGDVSIVLVHGAWADGSSWEKVVRALAVDGFRVVAAPLPLTSFADDMAALEGALERVTGPVALVGHAYTGAVIAATRAPNGYVAALAPDQGGTVVDVFYRTAPRTRKLPS